MTRDRRESRRVGLATAPREIKMGSVNISVSDERKFWMACQASKPGTHYSRVEVKVSRSLLAHYTTVPQQRKSSAQYASLRYDRIKAV